MEGPSRRRKRLIATLEGTRRSGRSSPPSAEPTGRDALAKAKSSIERAKQAIIGHNTGEVLEHVGQLERSEKMFRGVPTRLTEDAKMSKVGRSGRGDLAAARGLRSGGLRTA